MMNLCQKNQRDSAHGNEIYKTEGSQKLKCMNPDGKREKNHVYCLLDISDNILEQEQNIRSKEFFIGTGWEEAVQGWGMASPTACIWPRKKCKKTKAGECVSSCLLCLNMLQVTDKNLLPEPRPFTESVKPEVKPQASTPVPAVTGKEEVRPPSQEAASCSESLSKEVNKISFPPPTQGERKSLQVKEFVWHPGKWLTPDSFKDVKRLENTGVHLDKDITTLESLNSKSLLVLPPLKTSSKNNLDVIVKKSKGIFTHSEEKLQSSEKAENISSIYGNKTFDHKGEKRIVETIRGSMDKHLKFNDGPSFSSKITRTLFPEPERCCLHWSFLPEKDLAPSPNSVNSKKFSHLTTLRLMEKQGMQNGKVKIRNELRPPVNIRKRNFLEAKRESQSKTLEAKVFSGPMLPSLTVNRVVIPMLPHRLL
ncbi:uncharacterized protein C16orf46 homolog isoform X1 [Sarcophilus harrisii]|uniref:Uncharacterized protein n=1 Tax=Sarcophilus harrisii TaxID=9305 RepID=A0A7N4PMB8_SARHA|nr:uncharacterized protein C16orf46 homolog isoform X1 [Sarcophilus harrisii]XP_012395323.1 uncharacterized protein C16orf46 homolog isoform X1 [Sarcophilus harrisii]XP_012395324.1 uncharacterized protein C16orf46 homolog isoform X1 [Sarcophilus harrisii]